MRREIYTIAGTLVGVTFERASGMPTAVQA
jgi:hypothetical protein